MKTGKNQPIQVGDWDDKNARAVRNLYASCDFPSKTEETQESRNGSIKVIELNELKTLDAFRLSEQLRQLRLPPIDKKALWTKPDAGFLDHVREENLAICYVENPKSKGSASRLPYRRVSRAGALREALKFGVTVKDIRHDYRRGFIKFPPHEPDLRGRIYSAAAVAADHGTHQILDGVGRLTLCLESLGLCLPRLDMLSASLTKL